jgi:hypothetical protein
MRYATTHKDEVKKRGEQARSLMVKNFSLMQMGANVAVQLERIYAMLANPKSTEYHDNVILAEL